MDIDVRGTRVVLRDRLLARDAWPLRTLMARGAKGETLSFEEEAGALALVVESWGFAGDPQDVNAYAELDLIDFMVLDTAVGKHLAEMFTSKPAGDAKN